MSEPMIERIVRVIAANGGHAMRQNDIIQKLVIEENAGGGVIPDTLKERVACTVNGALYSDRGKRLLVNDNGNFSLNGGAMAAEQASFRKGRGGAPRADGKIYWTDAEREQVAQRLAEMRRVDMKARMGTLFRKAQEVLPEARRRRPSAPLMKFLSDRVARLVAGEKVVVEQNPPQILEVVVERVPDYAKVIRETPTPDLVAVLTERFFEGMQSAITAAHKGEAPAKAKVHSPSVVREAPPPPPPKTRVGILGLGGDREHVLQKVGHLGLDIVFLDGHPHHTPARADFYIIHKTAAHAWHDRLKAQVSHSRVFFADGGISEVVRYLHDIHARQKSQ